MLHQNRPGSRAQLEDYLSDPERVLQDLLRNKKLRNLGSGRFRHVPRPIELAGYRIAPRVKLLAEWESSELKIKLLSYRLHGLESLESKATYDFNAMFTALPGELVVTAAASLTIRAGKGGVPLPAPLLSVLAGQLLGVILGRLQKRCSSYLPGAFDAWAH